MLHAFPRTFALPADRPLADVPPMMPHGYLRLRRKAAGLSVDQVAARLAPTLGDVDVARDVVKLVESPGVVAKRDTLDRLRAVFAFDADVYHQLAAEPADRHPRVCRGCGCSQWDACDEDGQGCAWATSASCTRCVAADAAA